MLDLKSLPEFDNHKYVIAAHDPDSGMEAYIAIHRGNALRPSFGATRYWEYAESNDGLRDALRLSRLMSYKSAMAELRFGGAKAVLIKKPGQEREQMLLAYAQTVNDLHGQFITGTDVGMEQSDVRFMHQHTRYVVGLKTDPTHWTAQGLFAAIKVAIRQQFWNENLKTRSFALQGAGKIGQELLSLLYPHTKQIVISDINQEKIRQLLHQYPGISSCAPQDIHRQDVDVFLPCALSGSLTKDTVPELRAKAVVGGANNQLASPEIGQVLHEAGILYAPDYIVNAGGLISVVYEYEHGKGDEQALSGLVARIGLRLQTIFDESLRQHQATSSIADQAAQALIEHFH
jgi:leucine dehydrogenase